MTHPPPSMGRAALRCRGHRLLSGDARPRPMGGALVPHHPPLARVCASRAVVGGVDAVGRSYHGHLVSADPRFPAGPESPLARCGHRARGLDPLAGGRCGHVAGAGGSTCWPLVRHDPLFPHDLRVARRLL